MISHLTGTLIDIGDGEVVVDVNGVGYEVFVTPPAIADSGLDDTVSLWVHHAVREDASDLYGFADKASRRFFRLLLGVSGVGPKSAIGILSVADAKTLAQAVAEEDTSYLTQVSGIGPKTADKIVLELRDKITQVTDVTQSKKMKGESDTLEALTALGYSKQEAREAIKQIDPDKLEGDSTSERVKEALKLLGS